MSAHEQLGPGLSMIRADNPGPLTLEGTRTYLVGEHRIAVLDPGPSASAHMEALVEAVADRPVEAVVLTHAHADHSGLAGAAAQRFGAPVAASTGTLERVGLEGRALADGEEVAIDGGRSLLRAIPTPGHAADHLSFLWTADRTLFTGDLVLGRGSSVVAYPDGSVSAYLASLARLHALRAWRIAPGHGPMIDDPGERLEAYRAHRLARTAQVREAIEAGARSVAEIRQHVYGSLAEGLAGPAELSVRAHLAHLRELGEDLPAEIHV